MTSYDTARKIAYLMAFSKDRFNDAISPSAVGKRVNADLSDEGLATLLNKAQSDQSKRFVFTREKVNELRHGKIDLEADEETAVLHAFRLLFGANSVDGIDVFRPLPKWLEETCADNVRPLLRENRTPVIQGEDLGALTPCLSGLWQCFYVRPLNNPDVTEPQLQGFVLHFRTATQASMTVEFLGHDRRMSGTAHAINRHLYMFLPDHEETNTSMLVVNQPAKSSLAFAGAGVGLARPRLAQAFPSAVAFVCYGQKCEMPAHDTALLASIKAMARGDALSGEERQRVRNHYCKIYASQAAFNKDHAALFEFMQGHDVNAQPGLPRQGIFMKYP